MTSLTCFVYLTRPKKLDLHPPPLHVILLKFRKRNVLLISAPQG